MESASWSFCATPTARACMRERLRTRLFGSDIRGRLRRGDGVRRTRGLGSSAPRADWMLTFRYTYDVEFRPDTMLGRYGFRTRGEDGDFNAQRG